MSIETLTLPFQFVFMQNAFFICLIISPSAALLSCYLVLKGWALMGDAVSHSVLPGVVLAYVIGWPLIIGALIAGMLCALASGYVSQNSRLKHDTVLGIIFSAMFGIGLILYISIPTNVHLDHILFGNMLGINETDLWTSGVISLCVCAALIIKWKDFLLHCFDPAQAHVCGLHVRLLHYGLLSALSLSIVAVLSAVGLILAIGIFIAPGAIAFLITRQFHMMLLISVIVCIFSMTIGVYASFYLNSAPAPTIILVFTILFILFFSRNQIIIARLAHQNNHTV
ncbi:MAG: metal ABC transporter permease [Aestuariivita sp.]|nr:metal ABC transporter permease [Aestuariivita sp.]